MGEKEPDAILVDTSSEGITTITLNRSRRRNAVDSATAEKLYNAFISFENDPSQKVCIFNGNHGTFCAGADLHSVSENSGTSQQNNVQPVSGRNIAPMGPSRLQVLKPVIAVVTGHAVAGGLELSLIADIRIAESNAIFGVFCRRWGVPLIDGGTVRLPKIIGLGRALDMILTGRPVDANEALHFGLANRVVEEGKGMVEAWKMARLLLQFPEMCMLGDRKSAYYGMYEAKSFEEAMRNEFEIGMEVIKVAGLEGVKKFSQGGEGRGGSFEKSKM